MDRKEIAKPACGVEAFHAVVYAALWLSGTRLRVFGIRQPAWWDLMAFIVNAVASIILGIFASGPPGRQSA